MRFSLIMPAAGRGTRLQAPVCKALVRVAGMPLFVHAARPFLALAECAEAVIAAPADSCDTFAEIAKHEWGRRHVRVVAGGKTRQESVAAALAALTSDAPLVLVHDAARPLVSPGLIVSILSVMDESVAAVVPALAVTDTLKRVAGDPPCVVETVARHGLFAVQTPQAVRHSIFMVAHRRAHEEGFVGTDDVSLVERYGLGSVRVVPGEPQNIKVTTGEDLDRVREVLASRAPGPGNHSTE